MTGDRPGPDLLAVAERVLELLGEGQYVATYKYAVMLALLDLVLGLPEGQDPTTHQLAEKIVQLYWPHTAPYGAREPSAVLRQNSRGQAEIVRDIARFRHEVVRDRSLPLVQAQARHRAAFERPVRQVELKLIEMPLARLQVHRRPGTAVPVRDCSTWCVTEPHPSFSVSRLERPHRDGHLESAKKFG